MQAPVDTPGSSKLTPEQTAELEARYGLRYRYVQDGSHGFFNRKARRKFKRAR